MRFQLDEKRIQQLWDLLFFPLSIFYMELVLRLWGGGQFFDGGLIYIFFFAAGAGLVCNLIVTLLPWKAGRVLHWGILLLITFIFGVQLIFYSVFRTYMEMEAWRLTGDVLVSFWSEILRAIGQGAVPLLMLLLPTAFFSALGLGKRRPLRGHWISYTAGAAVVLHVVVIASILLSTSGILPRRAMYREHFNVPIAVQQFGLFTSTRLDLRYTIFGRPEVDIGQAAGIVQEIPPNGQIELPLPPPIQIDDPEPDYEPEPMFGYNMLDIDFDVLIANETNPEIIEMHEFFAARRPTQQHEFSGMFEGKNLIWLIGEAFHTLALHAELTPTLYRMANEGFIFNNFYNPDTGFSTTGGEFMTKTGLIPTYRDMFMDTGSRYMPFGFGNLFRARGYETFAYHNHTYTFYGRHLSHPNLGYDFYAIGNGLEITNQWPRSDIEMVQATVDDFIDAERFHVYYLTVSGHLEYNFFGNTVAFNNREYVEHLPYSTGPRAYLATQMELDRALAYLIERLDEAGRLEDTVFALSGDHYPFGLTNAEIEELQGFPMDAPEFDLHRSTFIIWNAAMEEPIEVDAFSSSLDVMPTLANLFNLPVDSRLVMGRDILSDAPAFVPFATRSWISQYGRFSARTGNFTPHPGVDNVPEGHAQQIDAHFTLRRHYSAQIVELDYYRILFGGDS